MSNVVIDNSNLTNIANAIRYKKGVEDTYQPNEMAAAIESISGGGDAVWGSITGTLSDQTDLNTALSTKSSKSNVLTCTLTTSGWSNYQQTITSLTLPVNGYIYIVSPDNANLAEYASAGIYADDVTTANTLVFHCESIPTSDLIVTVLKQEIG